MICAKDRRRDLLRARREKAQMVLNGLDYVELDERDPDHKTLLAYFIGKLPAALTKDGPALNKFVRVDGGRRIRDLRVLDVDPYIAKRADQDDYLVIRLDKTGDLSTYTLRLVGLDGIDPRYDHADFSFAVNCPSDLDCAAPQPCPPPKLDEPEINYLAKDYASFRQLILDRLALIMPDWTERHIPDLGITLVELLAYVGDHLSYYQDAVATEAYLDTARQRISVRRHARLANYFLHEGCNARAWLALSLSGKDVFDLDLDEATFFSLLDPERTLTGGLLPLNEFRQLPEDVYEVFEPVDRSRIKLRQAHNEIKFYTWGDRECCLPIGSTAASLLDTWVVEPPETSAGKGDDAATVIQRTDDGSVVFQEKQDDDKKQVPRPRPADEPSQIERVLDLNPGDVLIFEEVIGPKTGNPADADLKRRVAVRLKRVTLNEDPVVLTDGRPTPLVDIEWAAEDALSFALCLSSVTDAPDCKYLPNVSLARGNVILVDNGRSLDAPEPLGVVPLKRVDAPCECEGRPGEVTYQPGLFRPQLKDAGLTFRQSRPADDPTKGVWVAAAQMIQQDPRLALPQIHLSEAPGLPDGRGNLVPPFTLADLDNLDQVIERLVKPTDRVTATLRTLLTANTRMGLQQLQADGALPAGFEDDLYNDLIALLRAWVPLFDLLGSGPDDLHFVVEMDNEGVAHLRFGDNDLGEQPPAGSGFYAHYRVGNGRRGNLGAETITHLAFDLSGADIRVRNPLPATGGRDPEPLADAKLYAPFAFRKKLVRAIIAEDYATLAQRDFERELQAAAARLAWTGSWYEADVALDPYQAQPDAPGLAQEVEGRLEDYRRMGHDLRVAVAREIPLDIELHICVKPDYLRGHVEAALLERFSNRILPDGEPGFFHPDRLVLGEDIYLSTIVAEAQSVKGVSSVKVTKFQRLFNGDNGEILSGVLPLGPFEVARIDNDPSFPENGKFSLVMDGGR